VTLASVAAAVWISRSEQTAVAQTVTRAGDYIMVTGPVSTSREAILVIDIVNKRANLYVPKAGAGAAGTQFELKGTRNLALDFAAGGR
jgi:hypothetical protein